MAVDDARSLLLSVAAGAVLLVGITGCAPGTGTLSPVPSGSASSSSPSASESASPQAVETFPFVPPTTCTDLVGAELEAQLLADGRVLLLGSNGTGLYAGEFFPSSQEVGTPLTCVFGKDDNTGLYIEFDVQSLTPDAYQAALSVLTDHEFTESTEGDVRTFALVGGVSIVNTQVHVLRSDSWITIVNLHGGTSAFDETNEWLETVATQVYPEP